MITQHVGDEPPGDEDYYNMVEEEIIKATGSGRNPNAAAWDPEKTELHRIVNQLLALEDRRVKGTAKLGSTRLFIVVWKMSSLPF